MFIRLVTAKFYEEAIIPPNLQAGLCQLPDLLQMGDKRFFPDFYRIFHTVLKVSVGQMTRFL